MKSQAKVSFFFEKKKVQLKKRTELKQFILFLFLNENKKVQFLHIIFCSDDFLLQVNQTHLGHNTLTDVITFPLNMISGVEAEIYISVDRVKENAQLYKTSFRQELLRVIFHGCLHLCGYNDKRKVEQLKIRSREEYYLQEYNKKRFT